jgi:hypothetical protein
MRSGCRQAVEKPDLSLFLRPLALVWPCFASPHRRRDRQVRTGRVGSRYHLRQKRTIQFRSMSQSNPTHWIGEPPQHHNGRDPAVALSNKPARRALCLLNIHHHSPLSPRTLTLINHCHLRPSITHLSPPSQPRLPPRRKLSCLQNITRRRHLTNFLSTLSHLIPASIGSPFDTKSAANPLNLLCPLSFASSHPSSAPPRPPAHHHHYYPFSTQNRTA